jgi:hypothetical protein
MSNGDNLIKLNGLNFVKVNGGNLTVMKSADLDHPGICVGYQTEDGDIIDVVYVEVKSKNGNKDIDVYTYEDVTTDEWTKKYTLKHSDIVDAFSV